MTSHIDIADLVRRSQAMARTAVGLGGGPADDGALQEIDDFGSNPGHLRMLACVPQGLRPGAPLVVALHGCGQTAGGYDSGSGWSTLAARQGFAVLLPEQRSANNMNRCFNWYEPEDTRRDGGEAASIHQMITCLIARHGLDPARVFITGLSAGGALTSTMLASYPEVFAAGAIIAGMPYGAAQSMSEAFEAMATGRPRPEAAWGALVHAASAHAGPWPRVAVWQGEADHTVRPAVAAEVLKQWRAVHGVGGAPLAAEDSTPAHRHQVWRAADGTVVLEHHAIAGMGHGVPIGPGVDPDGLGEAAPYMLDVGISSTRAIAGFFGLGEAASASQAAAPQATAPAAAASAVGETIAVSRDGTARAADTARARPAPGNPPPPRPAPADHPVPRAAARIRRFGPGRIIRKALTVAGLLKD